MAGPGASSDLLSCSGRPRTAANSDYDDSGTPEQGRRPQFGDWILITCFGDTVLHGAILIRRIQGIHLFDEIPAVVPGDVVHGVIVTRRRKAEVKLGKALLMLNRCPHHLLPHSLSHFRRHLLEGLEEHGVDGTLILEPAGFGIRRSQPVTATGDEIEGHPGNRTRTGIPRFIPGQGHGLVLFPEITHTGFFRPRLHNLAERGNRQRAGAGDPDWTISGYL
jgi:hypothetical protein